MKNEAAAGKPLVDPSVELKNSVIIEPSFVGAGVKLENTVVGPYASIGNNTEIRDARVQNSIIQHDTVITNMVIENSMIGSKSNLKGLAKDLSVGDYTDMNA